MKRLTKKYVIQNTSISKNSTSGSTLEGCRFEMSGELQNRQDDRLYDNMEKWGWIIDKGRYCITWEGIKNLKTV